MRKMRIFGYINSYKDFSFSIPIYRNDEFYYYHVLSERYRITEFVKANVSINEIIPLSEQLPVKIGEFGFVVFIGKEKFPIIGRADCTILNVSNYLNRFKIKDESFIRLELEDIKKSIYSNEGQGLVKKPNNKIIRLGLSLYPDFVLIDYFNTQGFFKSNGIDLVISYYPWNQLFDKLHGEEEDEDEIDIIITNHKMYESEITNRYSVNNPFKALSRALNKYEGFAIVTRNKNYHSYNSIKDKNTDFDARALKSTIDQIKEKHIFAAKNTDHRLQFVQTIEKLKYKKSDFLINDNNNEPYTGFKEFLDGKYDVFIGAAVHTQELKKRKFNVILSEQETNIGATQYNIAVTKKSIAPITDNCLNKFIYSINQGYENFSVNNDAQLKEIFKLYKLKLREKHKDIDNYLSFRIESFRTILKQTMKFNLNEIDEYNEHERKKEEKDERIIQMSDNIVKLLDKANKAEIMSAELQEKLDGILKILNNVEMAQILDKKPFIKNELEKFGVLISSPRGEA